MKKHTKAAIITSVLAFGGALAQGQDQNQQNQQGQTGQTTPPAQSQTTLQSEGGIERLTSHVQGIQRLVQGNASAFTQAQAREMLPYLRALRTSSAITPLIAAWYAQNIEQRLTPEQLAVVGGGAAGADANQGAAGGAQQGTGTGGNTDTGGTTGGTTGDTGNTGNTGGQTGTDTNTNQGAAAAATPATAANPFAEGELAAALDQLIEQLTKVSQTQGG